MAIRNLLFDLDGTLTDPEEGITRSLAYAIEHLGHPLPTQEQLRKAIGPPLMATFPEFLGSDEPELIREAIRLYRERFETIGLYENSLFPGMADSLFELRGLGYRLFVATSKPEVFATRIVEHFGIASFFEQVCGSELDGRRDDKAEVIAYCMEGNGLRAEECLMIGDRKFDVLGAKHHGIPCLGVTFGFGDEEELIGAGAVALCAEVAELVEKIESLKVPQASCV